MVLYGKLASLTKSGLEKRVQVSNIEKGDVFIDARSTPSLPYIKILLYIRNGSEVPLKVSRIYIPLKVNSRDLNGIEYDFNSGIRKGVITTMLEIPPNNLNFLVECETTKLDQVIPNFKDLPLRFQVFNGIIHLQSRMTKIEKEIRGGIKIEPKEWE